MPRPTPQNFTKSADRVAEAWVRNHVAASKYDHIDFKPPESVARAAERGLEYRKKGKGGGLSTEEASKQGIGSGVQRAVNLKNRDTLSPATVRRMSNFFSRHEKNKAIDAKHKGEPWKDKGYVAWLLWGGDPGRAWADKVVRQMDAADEKKKGARFAGRGHSRVAKVNYAVIADTNKRQWPTGEPRVVDRAGAIAHQQQGGTVLQGFKTEDEAKAWSDKVKSTEVDIKKPDGSSLFSGPIMEFSDVAAKHGLRFVDRGRLFALVDNPSSQLGRGKNSLSAERRGPGGAEEQPKKPSKEEPSKGEPAKPSAAQWKQFLAERYDGGKKKVLNTNPKTRKRYPEVAASTLYKASPHFRQQLQKEFAEWAQRQKTAKATGRKTGPGESVGLFIPLPKDLAKKFPSLGEEDSSPSHVTFLYIGDFKGEKQQEKLLEVLRESLRKWWPRAQAKLSGLRYFDHHDKDRRVPHVAVEFDKDMSGFKHRLKQELAEAGIEVGDRFPEFRPHVTLAYMPGMDAEWKGDVPEGEWEFDEIEVWGLPELHKIPLGPQPKKVAASWVRSKVAGWWSISPGSPGINPPPVDKGGLMNAVPGTDPEGAQYNGDGPADIMGDAFEAVNGEYLAAWGRPATSEEMQAVFDFVHGGYEDEPENYLPEGEKVVLRVASRYMDASVHRKNVALMKWLSQLARRLGVGRDTYVVGGAVRNFLIDRPIKDIDIVIDTTKTGRDSDWLAKQIARNIPVPTNVTTNQYGVAILTVKGDWMMGGENLKGEVLEIANARKENYGGAGGKGYKPHAVAPATIEEDLRRRDFTMNTLMWRLFDLATGPEKAEVVDLMGCGRRDLEQRTLKCPQDPDRTFSDDPTRMLRLVRFVSKYNMKVPPDVAAAVRRNAHKLKRAPWEAVASILMQTLEGR